MHDSLRDGTVSLQCWHELEKVEDIMPRSPGSSLADPRKTQLRATPTALRHLWKPRFPLIALRLRPAASSHPGLAENRRPSRATDDDRPTGRAYPFVGEPHKNPCSLRHTMRFVIAILCFALVGCASLSSRRSALVARIHNDHICWNGSYFGLIVCGIGETEQHVLRCGPACRTSLIAALSDESRFVAAHVLPTMMEQGPFALSVTEWNHLKVDITANGVEIHAGQMTEIQKLWAPQ